MSESESVTSSSSKLYSVDLTIREGHAGYDVLYKCPSVTGRKDLQTFHDSSTSNSNKTVSQKDKDTLDTKKKDKAMQIALNPGKQIGMNAFMMYMSGRSLNIFSISITSMAMLTPLTNLVKMDSMFGTAFEGVNVQMPKLIFVALNLVWFAVGLYKMSSMRLLPTTSADWTGSIVWKEMMETSSIPPSIG